MMKFCKLRLCFFCVHFIRYDLRIRYIPSDFLEKLKEDKTTLLYFYQQVGACHTSCFKFTLAYPETPHIFIETEMVVCTFKRRIKVSECEIFAQVRTDYMQFHASKVSDGMALQLGCLEIRYRVFISC